MFSFEHRGIHGVSLHLILSENFAPTNYHVLIIETPCVITADHNVFKRRIAQRIIAIAILEILSGERTASLLDKNLHPILPGVEPGIFRSVGGRVIHCATRPYVSQILNHSY